MGRAYKVQCRECGTQFIHSKDSGYGVMPTCIGCGEREESQDVVRCPGCRRRVNSTAEEFRQQVIEETFWD